MDGVTLLCEPVAAPVGRRGIHLLVRDTGIGIRDSDLRALSADFQQVDAGLSAKYGGTGLGLSIRSGSRSCSVAGSGSRAASERLDVRRLPATLDPPADGDSARRTAA